MNDAEFQAWQEAARRGQLSFEELDRLARQHGWPAEQAELLRVEIALTSALIELPSVPVSSNFTHRVLEALDRETIPQEPAWRLWLLRHWSRLAVPVAAAAAVAIYLGVAQHQTAAQRAQLAASVHAVATLATAPAGAAEALDLEVWENFDVILRMGSVRADEELLRMFNKP